MTSDSVGGLNDNKEAMAIPVPYIQGPIHYGMEIYLCLLRCNLYFSCLNNVYSLCNTLSDTELKGFLVQSGAAFIHTSGIVIFKICNQKYSNEPNF